MRSNPLFIGQKSCDKCDLHDVQDGKHVLFYALAEKCAILEGDLQNNSLIVLVGLILEIQALFTLTTSGLRM